MRVGYIWIRDRCIRMCVGCILLLLSATILGAPPIEAKRAGGTTQGAQSNFRQGEKFFNSGDYDRAIDSFLQATDFARNNYYPEAFYYLGLCYKATHQDTKSVSAFEKSIEQAIGHAPDAHLELGKVLMRNERDQEAAQEFDKAVADSNGHGEEAQNALGLLAEKHNDLVGANYNFMAALGERPWKYTAAWMNYAELMMKEQKWGDAMTNFEEMLARGSSLEDLNRPRIYVDMGLCMVSKGNHQGALENWQYAATLKPDWDLPHLLLAQLFDKESHITSAINEYRAFLRLAPGTNKDIPIVKDRLAVLEQSIKPSPSKSEGQWTPAYVPHKSTEPKIPDDSLAPLPDTGF